MKYIVLENHPADSRVKMIEDDICQTLSSRMGTGGGNVPMVLELKDDTKDTDNAERSGGGGDELELRRTCGNIKSANDRSPSCCGNNKR